MNLPTVKIERPAPRQGQVDVAEEASTDDATNEQCIYEVLDNIKTTDGILSMELLEIPQGFLELAEEARNSGVEKKQSFLVEEVPPQVTGMTRPMIEPVSETTDEDLGKSVAVHREGTARVPTVKLEAGQLMQWPDTKSDGVMIHEIMLESEMSPVGSVRRTAVPVSVAAKSEMFTAVFAGGVVAVAAPLVVVEAVTSRVSVLPVVGSDLLTGLSVAAGKTGQLFLGSGSSLDKVGHGAGRSGVRMVPVESLPELREVRDIMFSCMRPVAVLTSQFFFSDEEGDLEIPLRINDDRASLQQEVDFNDGYMGPLMIEQAQGVGPAENRWDDHRILDIICWLCRWLNILNLGPTNGLCEVSGTYKWKSCTGTVPRSNQYPGGDLEVSGRPGLRSREETTGSVDRKGQYEDADWLNKNPNRVAGTVFVQTDATVAQYCSYITGILTKDWAVSNRSEVKASTLGYPSILVRDTGNQDKTWIRLTCVWFYNCLAGQIVMSSSNLMPVVTRPQTIDEVPSHLSESFLKHVSDSHLDKLYDLPEDIPNSNCVRIVTPDEHVNTGFHEILVYDMGQEEWPQVPLCDIGCLRLDWPKDLFAFVGRYQLELEQMRKACRDRFGPAAAGTCPTCEKYIQVNLGKHVALYHLDLAVMALPGRLVSGLERDITRLCGPHAQGTQHTDLGEGWEPGSMVSTMDSHSRTVAQYEQAIRIWDIHRHVLVIVWEDTRLSGDRTCLDCSPS